MIKYRIIKIPNHPYPYQIEGVYKSWFSKNNIYSLITSTTFSTYEAALNWITNYVNGVQVISELSSEDIRKLIDEKK